MGLRYIPCQEAQVKDLEGITALCKQAAKYAPHHTISLDPKKKWWWEAEDPEHRLRIWLSRRYVAVAVLDGRILAFQNCNPRPEVVRAKGLKKIEIEQIWADQTLDPDLAHSATMSLLQVYVAQLYLDAGVRTAEMLAPMETTHRPSATSSSRPSAEREVELGMREEHTQPANQLSNLQVERGGTVPVSESSPEQKLGHWKVTFTIYQEEIDKARRLLERRDDRP